MVFWGPAVFFRPFPCHPPYTREVGVPIRRLKILAKFALVTHDASATRPATTSTTAPPCPPPTRRARWAGRAVAYEAGFASRVVVVASSSVVRLGSTGISRKAAPTRKRSGPSRIATRGFPERSVSGVLRTCLVAFPRCDAAAGRPGGHGQFSCLGRSCITPGQATNQRG